MLRFFFGIILQNAIVIQYRLRQQAHVLFYITIRYYVGIILQLVSADAVVPVLYYNYFFKKGVDRVVKLWYNTITEREIKP